MCIGCIVLGGTGMMVVGCTVNAALWGQRQRKELLQLCCGTRRTLQLVSSCHKRQLFVHLCMCCQQEVVWQQVHTQTVSVRASECDIGTRLLPRFPAFPIDAFGLCPGHPVFLSLLHLLLPIPAPLARIAEVNTMLLLVQQQPTQGSWLGWFVFFAMACQQPACTPLSILMLCVAISTPVACVSDTHHPPAWFAFVRAAQCGHNFPNSKGTRVVTHVHIHIQSMHASCSSRGRTNKDVASDRLCV